MSKVVSSTELQKNTREIIDWARVKKESVVIQTYGKPMAALLSYEEYEAYRQYKEARARRFELVRQGAAENAVANRLVEADALALVEQTRQKIYETHDTP